MKRIGVLSCNIHCNFTNYGSALQSWALTRVIDRIGAGKYEPVLIDYCPPSHMAYDPLNPMKNMWDKDEQSRRECELSLPAIRDNYDKFDRFYHSQFRLTEKSYTKADYNEVRDDERLDAFVCGSDTIFCLEEFKGFDDAYYANYDCMQDGNTIAYAASFGDSRFDEKTYPILIERLNHFKAVGLREPREIPYLQSHLQVPCMHTIDPTLLLTGEDYVPIISDRLLDEDYILLYSRRFNPQMFAYADELAKQLNCKVVNISLRLSYNPEHIMMYGAGVEEFLSLMKYAKHMVTNSFHGLIFSYHFNCPYTIFTREQAGNKICDVREMIENNKIEGFRVESLEYLRNALNLVV